ncbi:MAG: GH3 auxin-responsive promoter family protein [Chloroflexi bacterium]|nr:GH3 auxin-responsive promoter family protein [Chloroflexota bacterium]
MTRAAELLQQGRNEELWQMCCGFLNLNLEQFMAIQKRLLLEQIELLNRCALGRKIMRGAWPETVDEFREQVPLTTYAAYCPELGEKREDILPAKPAFWIHTSGLSGEYPWKWVPMTQAYSHELSIIMYGVGILSCCNGWGDLHQVKARPKIVYTVAPRPYVSGTLADITLEQTPIDYLPPVEESEALPFDERIRLGFKQALSEGLDYFFGLSLVLAAVGDKFSESSQKIDIRPLLSDPKALLRLSKGLVKSKLAQRPMLPKDMWSVKGIISSGLDSSVYKEKIKRHWGRYPLDIYASTESSLIATQTWDYDGMTFIPNLNFLEFIPEKEHFKWQLDHSYQPETILLDEVKAGETYEIVITNFHGGALVRYRIGDMVRITSLRNEKLGIDIPQMAFERRADDLLDFAVCTASEPSMMTHMRLRLTEKIIWQAIENTGIAYKDWTALKEPGEPVLNLFIELKNGHPAGESDVSQAEYLARALQKQFIKPDNDVCTTSPVHDDVADMIGFKVNVRLLPHGAFANFIAMKQAEGADLAHLKPPHINPSEKMLSRLLSEQVAVEKEAVTV